MKQTAVKWLVEQILKEKNLLDLDIEKAIEMEKEQIIDFAENYELYESFKFPRKTFEQFYNETFNK